MTERVDHMDSEEAKKQKVKIGIGVLCLVVAIGSLYFNYGRGQTFHGDQRLYTDDDGQTWYPDSAANIPPYQHNGKTAHGAVVMSYAGGSKKFCAYVTRFPDKVRAQIMQSKNPAMVWGTEMVQMQEIKAPGKPGPWVATSSKDARAVLDVHAPDGSELDQVMP